jgi:hypothetical protein
MSAIAVRNRQARLLIWGSIRKLTHFSIREICDCTQQQYGTVHKYIKALLTHGYVEQTAERQGRNDAMRFTLTKDTGVQAPIPQRDGIADPNLDPQALDELTRVWQGMRQMRCFTTADLQAIAEVKPETVMQYVRKLRLAGYLVIQQDRESGKPGSWTVYYLARNTGPLAPILKRDGTAFDPNNHETYAAPADMVKG